VVVASAWSRLPRATPLARRFCHAAHFVNSPVIKLATPELLKLGLQLSPSEYSKIHGWMNTLVGDLMHPPIPIKAALINVVD